MVRVMDASSWGVMRIDGRGLAFPCGMTQPNGEDDTDDDEEENAVVIGKSTSSFDDWIDRVGEDIEKNTCCKVNKTMELTTIITNVEMEPLALGCNNDLAIFLIVIHTCTCNGTRT